MMADTGATYTCVNSKHASHLPMAGSFAKTVGFSGQPQLIPMTAPVTLKLHGRVAKISILVSDSTPVNLLGRDALCKMGTQILCTSQGIVIDHTQIAPQRALAEPKTANVYWVGGLQEQVSVVMGTWGKYIKAQLPQARDSRIGSHCTLIYDPTQDLELEERWQETAAGKRTTISSHYIIVGPNLRQYMSGTKIQIEHHTSLY